MRLVVGLLAASFLGAEAPAGRDDASIAYNVVILEMNGLGWRSTFYSELQPVARRGVATVWTARADAAERLAAAADTTLTAPKVTALPGVRATVYQQKSRPMVVEMTRVADGPVNHASLVGFSPKVENATEGYSVAVTGRKLDQGVLAQVSIEDRQITAVHTIALTEEREAKRGRDRKKGDRIGVKVQVPEYAQAQAAGEWLIPNEGVLLVSLGAHTVADAKGKAVVRERVALVSARAVEGKPAELTATPRLPSFDVSFPILKPDFPWANTQLATARARALANAPAIPMPAPAVPSRSLPLGVSVNGVPVPLPPLPVEHTPPTALPDSSEPCATPQSKGEPVGDPIPEPPTVRTRDTQSRRAGFETEPACCDIDEPRPADAKNAPAAPEPGQARTLTFRIPLKGDVVIEVTASARPLPPASAPAPPYVRPAGKP
jgi:hypothetical protein